MSDEFSDLLDSGLEDAEHKERPETTETLTIDKAKPEHLAADIIALAQSAHDPDELLDLLEMDESIADPRSIPRQKLRDLLTYAHEQRELDLVATAPTSIDPMSRKIDQSINFHIDILVKENKVLSEIAGQPSDKKYRLDATGEILTPGDAMDRIAANNRTLMEYKKALNEQRKSSQGAGNPNMSLDLNVNLGSVVSGALENIKTAETIDV